MSEQWIPKVGEWVKVVSGECAGREGEIEFVNNVDDFCLVQLNPDSRGNRAFRKFELGPVTAPAPEPAGDALSPEQARRISELEYEQATLKPIEFLRAVEEKELEYIAELEQWRTKYDVVASEHALRVMENSALRDENTRLRATLKPFADLWQQFTAFSAMFADDEIYRDPAFEWFANYADGQIDLDALGDNCQKARIALAAGEPEGE